MVLLQRFELFYWTDNISVPRGSCGVNSGSHRPSALKELTADPPAGLPEYPPTNTLETTRSFSVESFQLVVPFNPTPSVSVFVKRPFAESSFYRWKIIVASHKVDI